MEKSGPFSHDKNTDEVKTTEHMIDTDIGKH